MIANQKALKMQLVVTGNKVILPLTGQRALNLTFVLFPM
jgi:hypothetical protein